MDDEPAPAPWRPCDWLILPESVGGLIPNHDVIEWRGTPIGTIDYKWQYTRKGRRVYMRLPPVEWNGTWRE